MTTLVLETEPVAVHVTVTEDKLTVDLADGRSLVVRWRGIPASCKGHPQSGNTGSYSVMGMRSSGRLSMSILASKVSSQGDAVGKVPHHLPAGWPRAAPPLNKNAEACPTAAEAPGGL